MEKLQKRRATVKGQITKIKNDVNTNGSQMNYDSLKVRMEKVRELYNSFIQVEDSIFEIDANEESEMEVIDDNYFDVISKLNALMREKSLTTVISANNDETMNNTVNAQAHPDFKLPRLSLPIFDGNLKEWQSFFDIFTSTVHENTSLSAAQKFKYLKGQLRSPALDLIRHFRVDDNSYIEAFQRLTKRYDKKKPIIDNFIREFLNQPKISKATSSNITKLHDNVDETVRGLKALGKEAETRDPWLIYIALEKLDDETRRLWKYESAEQEFPLLKDFLDFLMKRMDSLMDVSQKSYQSKPQYNVKSFHASSPLPDCPLCADQSHRLCDCPTFRDMSIAERRDFIKTKSRCFNCLSDRHLIHRCPNRKRCVKSNCGRKHNSLLHLEDQYQLSPSSATEIQPGNSSQPIKQNMVQTFVSNASTTNDMVSPVSPRCLQVLANDNQCKLLPTALIQIRDSDGYWQSVRALLDSASTHSFITKLCADKLHLARKNVKGSVSTHNNTRTNSLNYVTNFTLRSCSDNSFISDVEAFIIPSITTTIPSEPLNPSHINHINLLQFADPNFATPAPVDVLLGCDQYFMCLSNGYVFKDTTLPIAQKTKFGWIVGGNFNACRSHDEVVMTINKVNETGINKILQRFWEIEELPVQRMLTDSEKYCLDHFTENTSYDQSTGKITTALPYKCYPPNIGESLSQAQR